MTGNRPDGYKIALLIDADNAPAAKIEGILSELSTVGTTHVRRAYGNWKKDGLKGWENKLHEHAIRPIQQFDLIKGKNATDIEMKSMHWSFCMSTSPMRLRLCLPIAISRPW